MTPTIKHSTASVFLLHHFDNGWHIGLIHHPRLHRWMLPGGHVEPYENQAEAALREVREETGLDAQLINTHPGGLTDTIPGVPVPVWIAEQQVPAESRQPSPHIHIDHLYLAMAAAREPALPAELHFGWFGRDDLDQLDMFVDSRRGAHLLFDHVDTLIAPHPRSPAGTGGPTI